MPNSIRQILKAIAPAPYSFAAQLWLRVMDRRYENVQTKIIDKLGLKVDAGPFAGMVYVPGAFYGPLDSKLIGCYEAELHEIIHQIVQTEYSAVVDIGCAEGYYAVGFARCFPDKTVYAFDSERAARELCSQLAQANNLGEHVIIGGACSTEELRALPLEGALVMCDCEGCELDLIDPERVPSLRLCDLLVELHDFVDPVISPTIIARFEKTHDIAIIPSARRDPKDYPSVHFLSPSQQILAVSDRRWKPDQWAFMTVKKTSGTL